MVNLIEMLDKATFMSQQMPEDIADQPESQDEQPNMVDEGYQGELQASEDENNGDNDIIDENVQTHKPNQSSSYSIIAN